MYNADLKCNTLQKLHFMRDLGGASKLSGMAVECMELLLVLCKFIPGLLFLAPSRLSLFHLVSVA